MNGDWKDGGNAAENIRQNIAAVYNNHITVIRLG